MKKSLVFLSALLCIGLLSGCQSKNDQQNASTASSDTSVDAATSSADESKEIRSVTLVDMDAALGAFRQVNENSEYPVTELENDGANRFVLQSNGENGSVWTLYVFSDLDQASKQFDELTKKYDTQKESMKDLVIENFEEGLERSTVMRSEKKDYLYQMIQQDNIVWSLEGKISSQETLYALTTEYFFAISPYLPSSLAAKDAEYMPEQNDLIQLVGEQLQVVSDELNLPMVRRENSTADLMGENKTVSLITENSNFAMTIMIFESDEAAQQYIDETNEFYSEFVTPATIKEDAFGKRYIFENMGNGTYQEMIRDGQTVINVLEMNGDRDYAENAISIYVDNMAQVQTESSAK